MSTEPECAHPFDPTLRNLLEQLPAHDLVNLLEAVTNLLVELRDTVDAVLFPFTAVPPKVEQAAVAIVQETARPAGLHVVTGGVPDAD